MGFALKQYQIQVRDERGLDGHSSDGIVSTGCYVLVYDAGTKTLSTIYSDASLTAKTNPISRSQFATDTLISFWSLSDSHDIFVAHSDGTVARKLSASPTTHSLFIDRQGLDKCMVFPMVFNSGGTEVDTGLDLPYSAIVKDVLVEVVTVDATETVDIGILSTETAGDADGLVVAASVATAGFVGLISTTVGGNETFISGVRAGALMGKGSTGTDVANDFGQGGGSGHVVKSANGQSISYTPSTSDTFAGYGYVFFRHIR